MPWKRGRIGQDAVAPPDKPVFDLKGTVGRIENPPSKAFFKRYVAKNRPVLISGALEHWNALSQWSDAYLAEAAGAYKAEVIASANGLFPDYLTKPEPMSKTRMTLAEFLDRAANPHAHKPVLVKGETLYIYGKPGLFKEQTDLTNDIPKPDFLSEIDTEPAVMWMSMAGSITPLHYDLINGTLCQIRGRKKVYFFPPDQDKLLYPRGKRFPGMDNFERQSSVDIHDPDLKTYPLFQQVKGQECLLEAGDVLFIPSNWYHEVETLDDSISIGFGFSGGTATSDFAAMANAFKSSGGMDLGEMQQKLMQNPELMNQVMQNPMFQELMRNPELIQEMMKGIKK